MAKQRKVSTSRVIAADRQALFDIVADPSQHPVIDGSGTVTGTREGLPERLALGTRFGMEMKAGASYKITNTVVEFEEGALLAWRHMSGHRWRYEFRDVPGGTEVTETFDWSTAKAKLALELAGFPKRNLEGMEHTLLRLEELATTGSVGDRA
ncbi:MAG: dimethyladenosine transferase [Nitriliruptor sp.]|nr:MAG: dimethyladenosine transferase [Nitriliruptor sp.]